MRYRLRKWRRIPAVSHCRHRRRRLSSHCPFLHQWHFEHWSVNHLRCRDLRNTAACRQGHASSLKCFRSWLSFQMPRICSQSCKNFCKPENAARAIRSTCCAHAHKTCRWQQRWREEESCPLTKQFDITRRSDLSPRFSMVLLASSSRINLRERAPFFRSEWIT